MREQGQRTVDIQSMNWQEKVRKSIRFTQGSGDVATITSTVLSHSHSLHVTMKLTGKISHYE